MARLSDDEAALLKAICRDRDDDLPRLVYADWLDEAGRPARAEFIRLQIAEANKPSRREEPYDVWTYRERRLPELLRNHRSDWLRELPKWALHQTPNQDIVFVRGFVESFAIFLTHVVRQGPRLLDRTPVRRLKLLFITNLIEEMLVCPWLREVPGIELSWNREGDGLPVALCRAEWLGGTRELALSGVGFGDRGAVALAGCPHLSELEVLDISRNQIGRRGMLALARSPHLWNLRRVVVGYNGVEFVHCQDWFHPRDCWLG